MPSFAIEPPPVVTLPIAGSDAVFPVRRVYCIGRNYAAHTIEMGGDPDREAPFFFQKNPDNLDPSGEFPYPPNSTDVHHEAELAVMLKSGGMNIPVDRALDHVYGYALALDMTRRDLQAALEARGHAVRIYLPFGGDWFPYFMRRLAERPANVLFVVRSLLHEQLGDQRGYGE